MARRAAASLRACVTAEETHSVFPEGTESSPSTQQHGPWCDCGSARRQEWGPSKEAAALSQGTHHGPAPAAGWCAPRRTEEEPRAVRTRDPRAGAAAASRGLPSQPLLRGRLGAPVVLGVGDQAGSLWAHARGLRPEPPAPPTGLRRERQQFPVPAAARGLWSRASVASAKIPGAGWGRRGHSPPRVPAPAPQAQPSRFLF